MSFHLGFTVAISLLHLCFSLPMDQFKFGNNGKKNNEGNTKGSGSQNSFRPSTNEGDNLPDLSGTLDGILGVYDQCSAIPSLDSLTIGSTGSRGGIGSSSTSGVAGGRNQPGSFSQWGGIGSSSSSGASGGWNQSGSFSQWGGIGSSSSSGATGGWNQPGSSSQWGGIGSSSSIESTGGWNQPGSSSHGGVSGTSTSGATGGWNQPGSSSQWGVSGNLLSTGASSGRNQPDYSSQRRGFDDPSSAGSLISLLKAPSITSRQMNNHPSKPINDEKMRICTYCGKFFYSHHKFEEHKGFHTGYRAYPCQSCEISYNRKDHLKRHISIVHEGLQFTCPNCNKQFNRKENRDIHLNKCKT